jgi:hypothetical protein
VPDPFCTIPWPHEGYQGVAFYNPDSAGRDGIPSFCEVMTAELDRVDTLASMSDAVQRVARSLRVRAEFLPLGRRSDRSADHIAVSMWPVGHI